jgi:hypothetical protein
MSRRLPHRAGLALPCAAGLLLLLGADLTGVARAEDATREKVRRAADAVQQVLEVGDAVEPGRLAGQDDPDPWAVADELFARGRLEAAKAFARAAPRPDADPERPTLSSLVLTPHAGNDGFLAALEVLRMEIPADLVVLSACETGRGKIVTGEGIVGLTRAFMHAGAPRVVCSLWKVDDDATAALMTKFYEIWKTGPTSAASALRRAQDHVRAQPKWKHPYYGAAWVLWGLP